MRLPTPSTSATTAATVTAPGRWPGASGPAPGLGPGPSGLSLALASALRCSEREGGFAGSTVAVAARGFAAGFAPAVAVGRRLRLRRPNARLLAHQRLAQGARRRPRVVGLRD